MNLIVRDVAESDVAEAQAWYDEKEDGVGTEFVMAVERILDRIVENPRAFERVTKNVRRALLERFPYVVYFALTDSLIEVFAVVHGHRLPRVWRSRL